MANINDFKIVAQKSKKYFSFLLNEYKPHSNVTENVEKERLGFYLFILEHFTSKKDITELVDIITDSEFNKIILGTTFDDCGVDAININEEEKLIEIFNFKYRENFKNGSTTINDAVVSTKFINALVTKNTSQLSDKIKKSADSIIEKLESNDIWKLQMYFVSNENIETLSNPYHLKNLEELYGLDITIVDLSRISELITLKPNPVDATLIIDRDAAMTFSESAVSSSKSYIIRCPLSEVVRITCNNKDIRGKYNIENVGELSSVNLDFSVLFDNVRGFVTKSKFNKNILETLENEPSRFFIYNNGLTLTVEDIIAEEVNAGKKIKIFLKSIQVLNGGQTLRTIHFFNKKDLKNIENNLSNAQVSLRIFKVSSDVNNKIAEFTNSQNSISNTDLKSLRLEQLQLEQYLDEHNIIYSRKSGDVGLESSKTYKHKISMEKFGQILFALNGFPQKISNNKQAIFSDSNYNEVFGSGLKIEDSVRQIEDYFEVKKLYLDNNIDTTEQKVFYILYINNKVERLSKKEIIIKLEEIIKEYKKDADKPISMARKLIQNDFKKTVDESFSK